MLKFVFNIDLDTEEMNEFNNEFNPTIVCNELCLAVRSCTSRGLYNSSKWAAELLTQIVNRNNENQQNNEMVIDTENKYNNNNNSYFYSSTDTNAYLLAKTYFDLREYDRCAYSLRGTNINNKSLTNNNNNNNNSSSGINQAELFLKNYAKYLAGEKRKNEYVPINNMKLEKSSMKPTPDINNNNNNSDINEDKKSSNVVINEENKNIIAEYESIIAQNPNNPIPILDGFNCYLLALLYKESSEREKCVSTLLTSLQLFPVNWSGWLLLTSLIQDRSELAELRLQGPTHWIHQFFYANCLLELHENSANEVISLLEGLSEQFPDSSHILVQTALAHYNRREFDEAQELFEAIRIVDPYRLENLDIYSNILYVKENKSELALLAHNSVKINKYSVESAVIIGNYYSLQGEHERAINYFKRALLIEPNYLSAYTLMGHEYIEVRNTSAAIECYRKAIEINNKDYRAWYGIGQTYEILQMNNYSLYYFKKAALLRPFDSRMWSAMAESYEKLNQIQHAIKCYLRAEANQINDNALVNGNSANFNTETSASNKLAKLYQKQGDLHTAAKYYKKLLKLYKQTVESNNTDEMSTDNNNNNKNSDQQVNNNQFSDEISAETIEALQFLAEYNKNEQQFDLAEQYCSRLIEIGGQAKDNAKAMLDEVKQLKQYNSKHKQQNQQGSNNLNNSSILATPFHPQQTGQRNTKQSNSFFSPTTPQS